VSDSFWGRFSDEGRKVVFLAQVEARSLKRSYIGTEHLLLAILQVEGPAQRALLSLDVTPECVRVEASRIVIQGEATLDDIPFSPRTKKVLESSLREALHLGHNFIRPEHIMLAMIREVDGMGMVVLEKCGVESHELYDTLFKELSIRRTA
jgi:ATP-dependent Clp protease ATP-binding subunit ClpC